RPFRSGDALLVGQLPDVVVEVVVAGGPFDDGDVQADQVVTGELGAGRRTQGDLRLPRRKTAPRGAGQQREPHGQETAHDTLPRLRAANDLAVGSRAVVATRQPPVKGVLPQPSAPLMPTLRVGTRWPGT